MTRADFAYRKAAAEGAGGLGLLIALYDTLAGDLRRAAEAERSSDIPKRSREVDHALRVIGHLEDWVRRGDDGDLALQLKGFYASLRSRLIDAQIRRSASALEEQMDRVLQIRETWQRIDSGNVPSQPEVLPPIQTILPNAFRAAEGTRHGNWSA